MPPKATSAAPRATRRSLRQAPSTESLGHQSAVEQLQVPADDTYNDDSGESSLKQPNQDEALRNEDIDPVAIPEPAAPSNTGQQSNPTSSRPSVQRLDSLKGRRTTTGRPTGILKFQPRGTVRRSKEERDAQDKVEAERQHARRVAAGPQVAESGRTSELHAFSRGGRGRGKRGGEFRGGLSGWRHERKTVSVSASASGPLGGPSVGAKRRGRERASRGGERGTTQASALASTATKREKASASVSAKKEPNKSSSGKKGEARAKLGKGKELVTEPRIKEEDGCGGKVSGTTDVELDDENSGNRINVDFINLISDEDSGSNASDEEDRVDGEEEKVLGSRLWPIRLDRHEHVERNLGVNTEASSATSAQLRQKATESQLRDGRTIFDLETLEDIGQKLPKSKSKQKDVEFVRGERRWKGVYQDDQELEEQEIKEEPISDNGDIIMADAGENEQHSPEVIKPAQAAPEPTSATDLDKDETNVHIKHKRRRYLNFGHRLLKHTTAQTEDDQAELGRLEQDMSDLVEELGASGIAPLAAESQAEKEGAGEKDKDAGPKSIDRRQNLVYLFQLPPFMPSLSRDPKQQAKTSTNSGKAIAETYKPVKNGLIGEIRSRGSLKTTSIARQQQGESSAAATITKSTAQLVEAADGTEETKESIERIPADQHEGVTATNHGGELTGVVGTLTVYESGVATIGWGGLEHELGRGGVNELLQEVVVGDLEPSEDGEGTAWAMGQVSAGFVMTPAWGDLLDKVG